MPADALVNAHAAAVPALEAARMATARISRRARKVVSGATPREQAPVTAINDWWRESQAR
jgi:hypothetical protein